MAGSKPRKLKLFAIGCGLPLLLLIVVFAVLTGSVFLGYREAAVIRNDLDSAHDGPADFTPHRSGAVPVDRMERFLAVREALLPQCEKASEHQRLFARMAGYADEESPPPRAFLLDVVRVARATLSIGHDFGDYVTTRNLKLRTNEMGLGEYTWLYVTAYYSWLGHVPVAILEGRPSVFHDRVFPQVREMIRRHVTGMEDAGGSVWALELEKLDRDPGRIPFEGDLPAELRASLTPFREEFERLACPDAGELDVVLTVRSGLGYDHR